MKKRIRKTPWPTKKVMEQIYDKELWGSNNSVFYSGEGSHKSKIIEPYLNSIIEFLLSFKTPLSVCDLGCGDFNIGSKLVEYSSKYIAIDIVPKLIEYNKVNFKQSNLEFRCLDISKDEIPTADCAIVRQVLQHLSNIEVQNILHKLKNYKYIILTENIPKGNFFSNIDIISGQGIRLKKNSGLCIKEAPFNFKAKSEKQLLRIELEKNKGVIETILYENRL